MSGSYEDFLDVLRGDVQSVVFDRYGPHGAIHIAGCDCEWPMMHVYAETKSLRVDVFVDLRCDVLDIEVGAIRAGGNEAYSSEMTNVIAYGDKPPKRPTVWSRESRDHRRAVIHSTLDLIEKELGPLDVATQAELERAWTRYWQAWGLLQQRKQQRRSR